MSGVGRKSSYRKGVTQQQLSSLPLPDETSAVVRITASRGSNLFDVALPSGEQSLAMMPTKFRKLIWVKRGDYVMVSSAAADATTAQGEAKVRFLITHILSKEQIRHIQDNGLWPEEFVIVEQKRTVEDFMPPMEDSDEEFEEEDDEEKEALDGGEGEEEEDEEVPVFETFNPNRRNRGRFDDEEEADDDDDDEAGEDDQRTAEDTADGEAKSSEPSR